MWLFLVCQAETTAAGRLSRRGRSQALQLAERLAAAAPSALYAGAEARATAAFLAERWGLAVESWRPLAEVADSHPGGRVVAVAGSEALARLCAEVLGGSAETARHLLFCPASVTTLEATDREAFEGQRFPLPRAVLHGLNDTCHLRG